ncbi:MAG: dihydrofolate reductase [Bacteroidota bacterium]|nr:dihydrofolate reductase [Bacteroidota bacterium]
MISIIVAVAENWAIGKNNQLLWHIPEDMKMFKRITLGHTVIMGKKTYESLPHRPLKDRRNIVITDNPTDKFEGCITVSSIDEALKFCESTEESFVIGGASIYRQFLPFADRLYITRIHKSFEGDVFFPEIGEKEWILASHEDIHDSPSNDFSFSFLIYQRKKA